jgi:uncharacterized membrane protein
MNDKKHSAGARILHSIRRNIIAGLLFLLPIAITYLVLKFLFNTFDGVVQPAIEPLFNQIRPGLGQKIPPGAGIIILVVFVYLIGLLGSNILGKWIGKRVQYLFLRVPLVGIIYSTTKQLIGSFSGEGTTGFKRVVMIEYPKTDCWTIGFLTNFLTDESNKNMALVYIPTSPTPNSGWVAIVPIENVYDTDLPVQEALRMVLSGGTVSPKQLKKRPALEANTDIHN